MTKPRSFDSFAAFKAAAKESPDDIDPITTRVWDDTIARESEMKAADDGSRLVTFVISTDSVDRAGDSIDVGGWKLEAYRKSPVVLWGHDSSSLPVAKAPKVWMEGSKLMAQADFTPTPDAWPRFNESVYQFIKHGLLSAVSVGFSPLKYAFVDDPNRKYGIDFIEQELLEFSVVDVPMNSEALAVGRGMGIDVDPVLDRAEELLLKSANVDRVKKLADSVLGADHQDERDIEWAKRIAAKAGLGLYSQERIDNIERAATAQRLKAKRARDLDLIRARG